MNLNKIAILANELGGFDEAAEALGVDENLITYALEGGELTDAQETELEGAWLDLRRDADTREHYEIDLSEINAIDKELTYIQDAVSDYDLARDLRYAYALGKITADDINSEGLDVFNDLPFHNAKLLVDWLMEDGHTAAGFCEAYLAARDANGGIWSEDHTGSLWWQWMREHGLDTSP